MGNQPHGLGEQAFAMLPQAARLAGRSLDPPGLTRP